MLVSVSNAESDLIRGLAAAFPSYAFESISPEQIRVESPEPIRLASLVRYIDTRNVVVKEARLYGPSLEDVFVRVTGIEADALKKEAEKKGATA